MWAFGVVNKLLPEEGLNWFWAGGVALAVGAQFVANLGLNLQRQSHQGQDVLRPKERTHNMFCRCKWNVGMMLIGVGGLGDLVALSLVTQSLVAVLGSLTMVANVIFAPLLLGEVLTKGHVWATLLVILGCATVIAVSPRMSEPQSVESLVKLFLSESFALYLAGVLTVCITLYVSTAWIERRHLVQEFPKVYAYPSKGMERFHPVAFAALGGILGAQSLLFGKGFAEIVRSHISTDDSLFDSAFTFVILPAMVLSAVLQIVVLNSGIKRFGLLSMVPIFQTFWTMVSVIAGIVVFKEWREMHPARVLVFSGGVLLTLIGVYLLSRIPAAPVPPFVELEPGGGDVEGEPLLQPVSDVRSTKSD